MVIYMYDTSIKIGESYRVYVYNIHSVPSLTLSPDSSKKNNKKKQTGRAWYLFSLDWSGDWSGGLTMHLY